MDPGPSNVQQLNISTTADLDTHATANASGAPARNLRRLSREGYAMLKEFHLHYPEAKPPQKRELLTRLCALPGCEHYTLIALNRYLYVSKQRDKSRQTSASKKTTNDILFPSFNAEKFRSLEVLYGDAHHPDETQINVWAKSIKVTSEEITNWIALRRAERVGGPALEEACMTALSHLPTPDPSNSPDPLPFSNLKFDPEETPQPPSPGRVPTLPFLSLEQLRALAEDLRGVQESKPIVKENSPASVEELAVMFAPHEEKMLRFLKDVNNRAYCRWGFEPHSDQTM